MREPHVKSVYASNGPAVNIATGIGGRRCSKRGSVSLNFKVHNTSFRVINMHLKSDTFANRMRDLSKILEVHRMALEDKGTNIFLVGAFNFSPKEDLGQEKSKLTRSSCEIISLKDTQEQERREQSIPGISAATAQQKKINQQTILEMISRLQEGDINKGII